MLPARKKRLFRAVAVTGALVLTWLTAEVALLLSGINNDYRSPATSELIPRAGGPYEMSSCGHVPYATVRIRYPTNPRGYFNANNAMDHTLNSIGWRDDEHRAAKPAGTYRILGLGDSYLFGQGVKPQDRCLDQLATLIQQQTPQRKIEVLNAGQQAYNTAMEARVLKDCGVTYNPDLVILYFVPNDVEPDIYTKNSKVEFFTEYMTGSLATDWMSQHSEVWALFNRSIGGRWRGRAYIRESIGSFTSDPEKWATCQRGLDDIVATCRKSGIKLCVAAFPFFYQLDGDYPFQPIHDRLRQYCEEDGIPFFDLRDEYRSYHGPELWVHPTDQHPNEQAHRIAAEATARFLAQHAQDFGLSP
jgi:hypothetical protein